MRNVSSADVLYVRESERGIERKKGREQNIERDRKREGERER